MSVPTIRASPDLGFQTLHTRCAAVGYAGLRRADRTGHPAPHDGRYSGEDVESAGPAKPRLMPADVAAFPGHPDTPDRGRHPAADDHDPPERQLRDLRRREHRHLAAGGRVELAVGVGGGDLLVAFAGQFRPDVEVIAV